MSRRIENKVIVGSVEQTIAYWENLTVEQVWDKINNGTLCATVPYPGCVTYEIITR